MLYIIKLSHSFLLWKAKLNLHRVERSEANTERSLYIIASSVVLNVPNPMLRDLPAVDICRFYVRKRSILIERRDERTRSRNFRFQKKKSGFRGLRGPHRDVYIPMEFRERREVAIEWMYISIGILRPRSTTKSDARPIYNVFGFILFLVPIDAQQPRLHISIESSVDRLNETVLCVSINSAKRKTSERTGRGRMARQTDAIGSLRVWQEGSFCRGIFLVYHRIN